MEERKTYTIGEAEYELLPPSFGVLRHVSFFCKEAADSVKTTEDLQAFLKDDSARFIAGLITPKGVHPSKRDLAAITSAVDWDVDAGLSVEIMDDFLSQPGASPENLLGVGRTVNTLAAMILPTRIARDLASRGETASTSSSDTSQPSPEGVPSDEGKSSGPAATPTSEAASK